MNVTPGDSALDLSTVTGAYFLVYHLATKRQFRWEATLSNQSPTTLLVTHVFRVEDTARLGDHRVVAMLAVPGGELSTEPSAFTIVNRFGV